MTKPSHAELERLLREIRSCRVCAAHLALGPRPVLRARTSARLLIVGQAPGTRVHETGIPWNDRSGERLRAWLSVSSDQFYDESEIAIVPIGFCYPGRDAKGGDRPPRPECAPLWHARIRQHLKEIALTLLVGRYAQLHYLKERAAPTLTETVGNWRRYGPEIIPMPHPSWRTQGWTKRNPWFEEELLPALRERVAVVLAGAPPRAEGRKTA